MAMHSQGTKKPVYKPAIIGFGLVILSILAILSGPLGSRMGWWKYGFAVDIAIWSAYVGIFAAVLCLSGLVVARPGGKRRGFIISLLGLSMIVPLLLYLQMWNKAKQTLPPIQDISTNTKNPPTFWYSHNSRMYGGPKVAALQKKFYPDIQPLILPISADKAFDLSIKLIRKKGWTLWKHSRKEKHIEATERTFWFGFSDDVVIHIRKIGKNRSRIDMRSTSRAGGGGDGGTNANRIRSFFKALKKEVRNVQNKV